jgi:hypothetical protein
MAKNIKELTEDEAKQILEFVYPNKDNLFRELSFEPKITEDGRQQVTLGMRSIIGIEYHNGQDGCIIHFDNTKVVLWLYKNGYDITQLLETNSYLSEMETDFENFAYEIDWLSKGEEGFREDVKQNWTLDYVKKKCKELLENYYYKDY